MSTLSTPLLEELDGVQTVRPSAHQQARDSHVSLHPKQISFSDRFVSSLSEANKHRFDKMSGFFREQTVCLTISIWIYIFALLFSIIAVCLYKSDHSISFSIHVFALILSIYGLLQTIRQYAIHRMQSNFTSLQQYNDDDMLQMELSTDLSQKIDHDPSKKAHLSIRDAFGLDDMKTSPATELQSRKTKKSRIGKSDKNRRIMETYTSVSMQTEISVPTRMEMYYERIHVRNERLLDTIRVGDIDQQLNYCKSERIDLMLPVIASAICSIPFGMTVIRNRILGVFNQRILENPTSAQRFEFFLNCYADLPIVRRTWPSQVKKFQTRMQPFFQELASTLGDTYSDTTQSSKKEKKKDKKAKREAKRKSKQHDDLTLTKIKTREMGSENRTSFLPFMKKSSNKMTSSPRAVDDEKFNLASPRSPRSPTFSGGRGGITPPPPGYESSRVLAAANLFEKKGLPVALTHSTAITGRVDVGYVAALKNTPANAQRKNLHQRKRSRSVGTGIPEVAHLVKDAQAIHDRTITVYEQNPIRFFYSLFTVPATPGFKVVAGEGVRIMDPIGGKQELAQIQVRKVFTSNAKPLLLDSYVRDSQNNITLSSSFILKKGDDLRKDAGVLYMFDFMNALWRQNKLVYHRKRVRALTYKCVAMGFDFGCIELIPDCKTLKEIKTYSNVWDDSHIDNLVTTAAGSYLAAYVMGIRDRHYDNLLLQSDGTLFHIDFGYVLGDTLALDTSKFAITSDLQQLMGGKWKDFVEVCVEAYDVLRIHFDELVEYARLVFGFLYEGTEIEKFLYDKMRMDCSADIARKYIYEKIDKAPTRLRTKLKNVVHAMAQYS